MTLAGVRLNVVGESNLWARRPAVFVANHQSSLDVLIVGSLVRRNLTGVAKKEARYDPRMIIGGRLMDLAFIDRSNPETAKRDVNALVELLLERAFRLGGQISIAGFLPGELRQDR